MVTVKDNYHAVSREIGLCVFVFYVSYVYYALLQSMYFAFLGMQPCGAGGQSGRTVAGFPLHKPF